MNREEKLKNGTLMKVALRTQGVDIKTEIPGVGSNIKEHIDGLYSITGIEHEDKLIPNELRLGYNITTKLVPNENSPFELLKEDNKFVVKRKGVEEPLLEVGFSKRPEFYDLKAESGMPLKYVGQVMGNDCLSIAVARDCYYFRNGDFCRFCNIETTAHSSGIPSLMPEGDVRDLIKAAGRKYRFIDLTGGTMENRDEETLTYARYGNVIKEVLGKSFGGPFSFMPPDNVDLLQKVKDTGVDVISFNRELWNPEAWAEVCPGKAKLGNEVYDRAFEAARDIWGPGNAVVQFIAGPWESNESLIEGSKYYADMGILPHITIFQPSPGSSYKRQQPKSLPEIIDLFLQLGDIYKAYPELNTRRSTLTSESGNRSSISNEILKGYITRDNYNPRDIQNMV